MSENTLNKLVTRTFNLTSLFADIKSEHNWSTYEVKTVMLLFSELDKYHIYLPDHDVETVEINENLIDAPYIYKFHKDDFIFLTGVRKEHLSREINKIRKSLISKSIHLPHPLKLQDEKSGISITWFTYIEYDNSSGMLELHVNQKALPRLLAFVKYSKVSFNSIAKLKNSYSIFTYLSIKIIKDSSYKGSATSFTIPISEYKEKIGVHGKYKMIRQFREFVLNVVEKEINTHTELELTYSLIKEGRSYNKIKFDFDYKNKLDNRQGKDFNQSDSLFGFNVNMIDNGDDFASPFEAKLVSWGIRAKKVVQIENEYSLDAISKAIDETEKADSAGTIKTTKSAFFIGVLENKEFESQKLFEEQQNKAIEEKKKQEKKLLGQEYDSIQSFIHRNESEISNYLSAKSMGATFELSDEVKFELNNLQNIDESKFKSFRARLPVLFDGYFDMKEKKSLSPNMYVFLKIIKHYD